MPIDPKLLEILACPEDHGALLYFDADHVLYNPRLKRSYPVVDNIPVMLIEESKTVDETEHQRLMNKASAEDIKQNWT